MPLLLSSLIMFLIIHDYICNCEIFFSNISLNMGYLYKFDNIVPSGPSRVPVEVFSYLIFTAVICVVIESILTFSGRKNLEHKFSGRDFKLGVPSLRFQAR